MSITLWSSCLERGQEPLVVSCDHEAQGEVEIEIQPDIIAKSTQKLLSTSCYLRKINPYLLKPLLARFSVIYSQKVS